MTHYIADAAGSNIHWFWEDWPKEAKYFAIFVIVTWFGRGSKVELPVSKKLWLCGVILAGLFVLAATYLPGFVAGIFFLTVLLALALLAALSNIGAENRKILESGSEDLD